jgi:orotidine-5'-phosphate decarboxylase
MKKDKMTFLEKIEKRIKESQSRLCIGLDIDKTKMPNEYSVNFDKLLEFNKKIIDSTKEYALAYKPNLAFYEVFGSDGMDLLKKTVEYIPDDIVTIADAKRGDIGNTAQKYAETFFEYFNFDSITVNPYMGLDSILPYLEYKNKGTIVLALTSNEGSKNFEKLSTSSGNFLYQEVASKMQHLHEKYGNLALVVGATQSEEIAKVRLVAPDLFFLVPGIGAQGGSVKDVLRYAGNKVMINASRAIIYASNKNSEFEDAAKKTAKKYYKEIITHLV